MTTTATPDLTLVVDLSNYTGEMTPAIVAVLVAAGVTDAFVRGSLESAAMTALARRQMQALGAGGIRVHTYIWCYSNWDAEQLAADTIAAFGDLVGSGLYALDIEDVASWAGVTPEAATAWHMALLAALTTAGKKVCIYSAEWCYATIMGPTTAFSYLPLWAAQFDGVETLASVIPFGGWS